MVYPKAEGANRRHDVIRDLVTTELRKLFVRALCTEYSFLAERKLIPFNRKRMDAVVGISLDYSPTAQDYDIIVAAPCRKYIPNAAKKAIAAQQWGNRSLNTTKRSQRVPHRGNYGNRIGHWAPMCANFCPALGARSHSKKYSPGRGRSLQHEDAFCQPSNSNPGPDNQQRQNSTLSLTLVARMLK